MSEQQDQIPAYGTPFQAPDTVPLEPAKLGALGRLTGVLFSPGETFEDINRHPTWIAPMIIWILLGILGIGCFVWRVKPNWTAITRAQIVKRAERTGQPTTGEQFEKSVELSGTVTKYITFAFPVFFPLGALILSGMYALGMMFIQAKTTFKKIFSVVLWTFASLGAISIIVTFASLMVIDTTNLSVLPPDRWATVVPTNLAALLDPTSPVMRALLTSIDVFAIWRLILMSIGLAAIAGSRKITSGKTASIVVGVWVLGTLFGVAMAAAFGG